MWEYTSKNSYPNISLHDCRIEGIRLEDQDVIFEFDDNGFWIGRDHPQNLFGETLRTDNAELRLINIDSDLLFINIHNKLRFAKIKLFTIRKKVSLEDFIAKVNSGKWKFEFVDEYYGYHRAMFCGCLLTNRKPYLIDAQIEVYYEESQYYWNKIYPDRTW